MNKERPKFYVLYKDFNSKKVLYYDVLEPLWDKLLTKTNKLKLKNFSMYDVVWKKVLITDKETLQEYITGEFKYYYWGRAEWEFIAVDWPYSREVEESNPAKIDVYKQLEPNIPIIAEIMWNFITNK